MWFSILLYIEREFITLSSPCAQAEPPGQFYLSDVVAGQCASLFQLDEYTKGNQRMVESLLDSTNVSVQLWILSQTSKFTRELRERSENAYNFCVVRIANKLDPRTVLSVFDMLRVIHTESASQYSKWAVYLLATHFINGNDLASRDERMTMLSYISSPGATLGETYTPIQLAVRNGDLELVKALINSGSTVDNYLVFESLEARQMEILKYFIEDLEYGTVDSLNYWAARAVCNCDFGSLFLLIDNGSTFEEGFTLNRQWRDNLKRKNQNDYIQMVQYFQSIEVPLAKGLIKTAIKWNCGELAAYLHTNGSAATRITAKHLTDWKLKYSSFNRCMEKLNIPGWGPVPKNKETQQENIAYLKGIANTLMAPYENL
jgi:hypothetical protein